MSQILAGARGKQVLLLNPPVPEVLEGSEGLASARQPPYGLLRLATWLRGIGAEVALLDALAAPPPPGDLRRRPRRTFPCGDDGEAPVQRTVWHLGMDGAELQDRLADFSPDVIAIGVTFTWHAPILPEVVAACRRAHPDAKIVLGGNFATLCPAEAAMSGVDEVVQGQIHAATFAPTALDLVKGPLRDDWIRLVRGCPHHCSYCVTPTLNDGEVRARDPDEVLAEIKGKVERHGLRHFSFHDDAILYRRAEHIEPLLDRVAQERMGLSLDFATGLAAHQVDDPLARRFVDAGVPVARLALETLDPERSRAMRRPTGRGQFVRAVEILKAHGFSGHRLRAFCLVGLPDQTTDEVLEAVLWLYGLGVTPHLTCYTLTPGSIDHERYRDRVAGMSLDELAPMAWRFAHPGMKVRELDACVRYFSQRWMSLERILDSRTDDPLIRRAQRLARERRLDRRP